jgi:hypothetical protein
MSNRKMWEMNKRLYKALSFEALLDVVEELTDLAAEREEMIALLVECNTYLDTNDLTSICSTSILHKKIACVVARCYGLPDER